MNKIISRCYVIESYDFGVEPVIYLDHPMCHDFNEWAITFNTPFEAKLFIQQHNRNLQKKILVTSETTSQLHLVAAK